MDKPKLIEHLGEIRMELSDKILLGEASIEDKNTYHIAGSLIVKAAEIKTKDIEAENCKHEMIARFSDGSAHCEQCGQLL